MKCYRDILKIRNKYRDEIEELVKIRGYENKSGSTNNFDINQMIAERKKKFNFYNGLLKTSNKRKVK